MCDSSNNWSGLYIPQGVWPVSNPTNPVSGFDYKSTRSILIQAAEMLAKHSGEIPEEFSSDEISVKYHNGHIDIVANFELTAHVQQEQKRDIRLHNHVMDTFVQYSDAFSEEERKAVDEFFFNLSAETSTVMYRYYSNHVAMNTKLDHPHQLVDEICVDAMNSPIRTIGDIRVVFPHNVRKVLSKFHCLIWTKDSCDLTDGWPHRLFIYKDNSKDGVVNTFMTRPSRLVFPILGKLGLIPAGDLDTSFKICEHLNRFFEECLVDILQEYSKSNIHIDGGLRFNTKEVDGIDGDDVRDSIVEYIVEHYGKKIKDYIERKQQ